MPNMLGIKDASAQNLVVDASVIGECQLMHPLSDLAGAINETVTKATKIGCEAIPAVDANIRYLSAKLTEYAAHPENSVTDQAVLAWRGIFAVIALSRYLGFRLTERELDLHKPANKGILSDVYTPLLEQCKIGNGKIVLLMKNDKPIAISHKQLGIVPFANLPADVMEDVSWYNSDKGEWLAIESLEPEVFQKIYYWKFRTWLTDLATSNTTNCPPTIREPLLHYATNINTVLGRFAPNTVNTQPVIALDDNRSVVEDIFHGQMLKVPALSTNPPDDRMFSEYLMITDRETLGVPDPCFNIKFSSVRNENYSILIPFSQYGVEYFKKNSEVKIQSIFVDVGEYLTDATKGITVSVKLEIDGGIIHTKSHKYIESKIFYRAAGFPFFSLWPYRRFVVPNDNKNVWQRYYVTMSEGPGGDAKESPNPGHLTDKSDDSFKNYKLSGAFESLTVSSGTHPNSPSWITGKYKDFPEYLSLTYMPNAMETYEIGCIYIKPPAPVVLTTNTVTAAIDFGTTNTVCAVYDSTGNLDNQSLINPADTLVLQRGYINEQNLEDVFHKYYWLSDTKEARTAPQGMIRSVVQNYTVTSSTATSSKKENAFALDTGRMILADGSVISYFEQVSSGNLGSFGIKGNIKLVEFDLGAKSFIEHIVLSAALLALNKGASALKLCFSYPDNQSLQKQKIHWRSALNVLSNHIDTTKVNFVAPYFNLREAEAAALYVLSHVALPVADDVGFAVMDIGGGTTDISLWKGMVNKKMVSGYSMHHAGNHLLSTSVFSVQKNFGIGCNLWDIPEDIEKRTILNSLIGDNSTLANMLNNPTTHVAGYLDEVNTVSTAVNAIMEVAPLDANALYVVMAAPWSARKMLCSLLRVKMTALFYVFAQMLKLLPEEKAPNFQSVGAVYPIALAGGGSRTCNLCGVQFMQEIVCDKLLREELGIENGQFIINFPTLPNKVEVAQGMLQYMKEKETGIDSLHDMNAENPQDFVGDDEMLALPMETIQEIKTILDNFVDKYLNLREDYGDYWFPYEGGSMADKLKQIRNAKGDNHLQTMISQAYLIMKEAHELADCPKELFPHIMAIKVLELYLSRELRAPEIN